ncbi:unnamed protein product [Discosporangium mesarthrocarpum]
MEQMMAEAMAAREQAAEKERKVQRRKAKKEFGGGLKKGFLDRGLGGGARKNTVGQSKGYKQLDGSGQAPGGTGKGDIPVISGRKGSTTSHSGLEFDVSAGEGRVKREGMVLPEVQKAMEGAAANPLGTGGPMSWLTPELLDRIAAKPRLAAMLTDPNFVQAMESLKSSPEDAAALFRGNKEAEECFKELTGMLSDHFMGLGQRQDEERKKTEHEAAQSKELLDMLKEPGFERVLRECQEPGKLRWYMHHPEFGPKIKRLAEAGLVQIHQ